MGGFDDRSRRRCRRLADLEVEHLVTRGDAQLGGEIDVADTWKPWLLRTAAALDVPVIDPTDDLAALLASGTPAYDDHWSPEGPRVIAEVLVREWLPRIPVGRR